MTVVAHTIIGLSEDVMVHFPPTYRTKYENLVDSEVGRSEVVAPLRHAVSLVDAGKGHLWQFGRRMPGPATPESPGHEGLWRQQQNLHPPLSHVRHDPLPLGLGLVGVETRPLQAGRELTHLDQ